MADSAGSETGLDDSGLLVDLDKDGWTGSSGDCNDADASVNPGAEEVPLNGTDENCDASDAGPTIDLGSAAIVRGTWEQAHGGFGLSAIPGDPGSIVMGAPEEPGQLYSMGSAYGLEIACESGVQDWSDANWDVEGVLPQGSLGRDIVAGEFGPDVGIVVAAPWANNRGTLYGIPFGLSGTVEADGVATQIQGDITTGLGTTIESLGDLDGDGWDDLGVGACPTDPDQFGYVYVMPGPLEGPTWYEDAAAASVHGEALQGVGEALAGVGDQTGDGFADLLIGATEHLDEGRAYLMAGPLSGASDVGDAVATIVVGDSGATLLGYDVANAGDLDGDGRDDLAVSAALDSAEHERGGSVYFFLDPLEGTVEVSSATATFRAESSFEWLGYKIERVGDLDGDGDAEVAVAAPRDYYFGWSYPGKVYLLGGPFSGDLPLENVRAVLDGEGPGDFAGGGLTTMDDLDGDGRRELLVGAPHNDAIAMDAGAAYLVCSGALPR